MEASIFLLLVHYWKEIRSVVSQSASQTNPHTPHLIVLHFQRGSQAWWEGSWAGQHVGGWPAWACPLLSRRPACRESSRRPLWASTWWTAYAHGRWASRPRSVWAQARAATEGTAWGTSGCAFSFSLLLSPSFPWSLLQLLLLWLRLLLLPLKLLQGPTRDLRRLTFFVWILWNGGWRYTCAFPRESQSCLKESPCTFSALLLPLTRAQPLFSCCWAYPEMFRMWHENRVAHLDLCTVGVGRCKRAEQMGLLNHWALEASMMLWSVDTYHVLQFGYPRCALCHEALSHPHYWVGSAKREGWHNRQANQLFPSGSPLPPRLAILFVTNRTFVSPQYGTSSHPPYARTNPPQTGTATTSFRHFKWFTLVVYNWKSRLGFVFG